MRTPRLATLLWLFAGALALIPAILQYRRTGALDSARVGSVAMGVVFLGLGLWRLSRGGAPPRSSR